MSKRENVSRRAKMVNVITFLMVIAAGAADLRTLGCWRIDREPAGAEADRAAGFQSKRTGRKRALATCALQIKRARLNPAIGFLSGGSRE